MKSIYLELLWKAFLAITYIVSAGIVATHERLNVAPLDKAYPFLLFLTIAYLHWMTLELFFAFLGVPSAVRRQMKESKKRRISFSGLFIAFGYVILALTILNHYMFPTQSMASDMITFSMKSISAGVFIQMLFSTREVVSTKFRNEK